MKNEKTMHLLAILRAALLQAIGVGSQRSC